MSTTIKNLDKTLVFVSKREQFHAIAEGKDLYTLLALKGTILENAVVNHTLTHPINKVLDLLPYNWKPLQYLNL
jgi:hypothetical protein